MAIDLRKRPLEKPGRRELLQVLNRTVDLRKESLEKSPPGRTGDVPAAAGRCPRCGTEYTRRAKFCQECGNPLSADGLDSRESVSKKRPSLRKAKSDSKGPESNSKRRSVRRKTNSDPDAGSAERNGSANDGEENAAEKGSEDLGCGGWCVVLAVLAGIAWAAWWLVTTFPRTCFWLAAPIIGLSVVFGIGFKGRKAILSILLLAGLYLWGVWAHSAV